MESDLQKRIYIFRKSYQYFNRISISLSIAKYIFCISGLSAFAITPLAVLSLGAGITEIIDKSLAISKRTTEYRIGYNYYLDLLAKFKTGKVTLEELELKQAEFLTNLQYFPREKYIKKMKMNGYQYS